MRRCAVAAVLLFLPCRSGTDPQPATLPVFTDVTQKAGILFRHDNAGSPEKYMIETMGAGCGCFDFDNDGWMDLYFANSAATAVYKPETPLRGALYRNNHDGTFSDVTAKAGIGAEGLFAMGVAAGDYDNDGWTDLFIAGYGTSRLFRNRGDGTFADVTARAGVSNEGRWASSAAWFDYDRDGRLDLAIANYVNWSPETNLWCGDRKPGHRAYCHPLKHAPQPPALYRNRGDGSFENVTKRSEIGAKSGNGLGIVTFDADGDGWQDVFIANDAVPNSLFRNTGKATFREVAMEAGVAVSEDGKAEAGMGVDAADLQGRGPDIFVTHLDYEHARLYRNQGGGAFEDATFAAKLGYVTYQYSGFGTRFIDYDNDGRRDVFIVNGHILDNVELYHANVRYAEPKLLLRNRADGTFANVTARSGPALLQPTVGRGLAACDYDNDGDIDVAISNNGGPSQLLRNDGGNRNRSLTIHLVGTTSNRDAVGARVRVTAGGRTQVAERQGGMSYQSAQDPRLHFGLGEHASVDRVDIEWPSGRKDIRKMVQANRVVRIIEGQTE